MVEWLQILLNASSQDDLQKRFEAAAALWKDHEARLHNMSLLLDLLTKAQANNFVIMVGLLVAVLFLMVLLYQQSRQINKMEKRLRKLSKLLDSELSDGPIRSGVAPSGKLASETYHIL